MNTNVMGSPDDEDMTKPFLELHRKRIRLWWPVLALILIAIMAFFVFRVFSGKKPVKNRLEAQLRVNEIIALEESVRQEQKHLLDLLPALKEKSGIETSGWETLEPPAEQLEALRQKAAKEKGEAAAYLAGLDRIRELKKRILGLEKHLGNSHPVAPGDTHFQISFDFLVKKKGMSEDEARRLLLEARLQEPLLPGFKVWNFWLEDGFCTFVTQGEAPITPDEAVRQSQQRQREEKEKALSRLNSLYFLVGRLDKLQSREVLTGGFLKTVKLGEVRPEDYRHAIDLREQRRIRISARSLGLKKISRLTIFPREFQEGQDYNVRIGFQGRWAQVNILRPDTFRGQRVVMAVE